MLPLVLVVHESTDEALFSSRRFEQQRPTAKELLQHRFVKYARKTSQLSELIDRQREWKLNGPKKKDSTAASPKDKKGKDAFEDGSNGNGTVMSSWAFDTLKSAAGGGDSSDEGVKIGTLRQVSPSSFLSLDYLAR